MRLADSRLAWKSAEKSNEKSVNQKLWKTLKHWFDNERSLAKIGHNFDCHLSRSMTELKYEFSHYMCLRVLLLNCPIFQNGRLYVVTRKKEQKTFHWIKLTLVTLYQNCHINHLIKPLHWIKFLWNTKNGLITVVTNFVAFCSFFPCSLTVVHRGRQWKSGSRQWKSSRADKQHCFP